MNTQRNSDTKQGAETDPRSLTARPVRRLRRLGVILLFTLAVAGTCLASEDVPRPRFGPATAWLADGSQLVAGGWDGEADRADAIVRGASGAWWKTVGTMSVAREAAATVVLRDGRVLVAGGFRRHSNSALTSTEIFDPATSRWSTASPMNVARQGAVATRLADGRVLVEGGTADPSALNRLEIFDPLDSSWTLVAPPSTARRRAAVRGNPPRSPPPRSSRRS